MAGGRHRPLPVPGILLLAGLALLSKCRLPSWLFAAPTLPPHTSTGWLGRSTGDSRSEDQGARCPQLGARSSVGLAQGAVLLGGAAAALIGKAQRRASARVELPVGTIPRNEKPKGEQVLPLGRAVQPLFSIRNRQFWDYVVNPRTYFARKWLPKDVGHAVFFTVIHAGALAAPFFFTWQAFWCFLVGYVVTGMCGITLSYHRQLAHRSFRTPKWLEYVFAYCGVLALQSHPISWVSSHRHHHGGTDTERDVHSPLDGFWWSHMGWMMDGDGTWMRGDKSNVSDLSAQWYYRFLQKTYALHGIVLPLLALYAFGGWPCVFWGFFARVVFLWHVTWAVNSVSHVWGFKDWNTEDNSMNNWLLGIFAFGEGWHNNHHAFETSCRHGLKWSQIDVTWYTIKFLSFLGLATELKYPSEGKMRKLTFAQA